MHKEEADDYAEMDVKQLCLKFGTDATQGMNAAAAAKRLKDDGIIFPLDDFRPFNPRSMSSFVF